MKIMYLRKYLFFILLSICLNLKIIKKKEIFKNLFFTAKYFIEIIFIFLFILFIFY